MIDFIHHNGHGPGFGSFSKELDLFDIKFGIGSGGRVAYGPSYGNSSGDGWGDGFGDGMGSFMSVGSYPPVFERHA